MCFWKRSKQAVVVTATVFGLAGSLSAGATPCTVLQYEEMKDMKVEELAKEYCTAENRASDMLSKSLDRLEAGGDEDEAASEMLHSQIGQCQNERDRIGRLLSRITSTPSADLWKTYCKKD